MDDRTVIEEIDRTAFEQTRAPASVPVVRGWLTVWSGMLKGRDFPLRAGRNFVGSDSRCDVRLEDARMPAFCFNVRIEENRWTAIDLDSSDGILVGDRTVFRAELEDEEWIRIGAVLMRVKKR